MSKNTVKNAKKKVTMSSDVNFTLSYNLNGVNLKTTLREDIPDEMEAWLSLMAQCKKDVEKRLDKLKNL